MRNVIKGIKAYLKAYSLISKLKLWKYFAIPIAISVITALVIITVAYNFSDNVSVYFIDFWKWDFGKETFAIISRFLGGVLLIILGLILYKHIVLALSAPFMTPVSEKIEEYLIGDIGQQKKKSFTEELIRGVRLSVRNISLELLYTIPLLFLSLIPVIGLLFTGISFLVQSYYAGFGNMDYTLDRHFNYKESIEFVKENKGIAIGNGIVFILFLLIPFIGIILVLPLSVTAATTETIKLLKNKEINQEPLVKLDI